MAIKYNFTLEPFSKNTLEHSSYNKDQITLKMMMTCVYSVICLFGIPGNALVILTIARVKELRNVRNLFIANLAVGDLTNMLWCVPTSAISLYVSWPYGEFVCKYIYPMSDVIIGNTIITMVQITIDRYRVICYPFASKATVKLVLSIIISTWVLSYMFVGLPLVGVMEVSKGHWVDYSCNIRWNTKEFEIGYRLSTLSFLFVIPLGVVLFCVLRIRYKLNETMELAYRSIKKKHIIQRAQKNKKLIKILMVIFSCFTICLFPINVLLIDLTFNGPLTKWKHAGVVFQTAIALLFFNSTMNPVILYLLSKEFRSGYWKQLDMCWPTSKRVNFAIEAMRKVSSYSIPKSTIRKKSRAVKRSTESLLNVFQKQSSLRARLPRNSFEATNSKISSGVELDFYRTGDKATDKRKRGLSEIIEENELQAEVSGDG